MRLLEELLLAVGPAVDKLVFLIEPGTELGADVEEEQALVQQNHHLRCTFDVHPERHPAQQQLPERDDNVHVDERKLQKELEASEDIRVSRHPGVLRLVLIFHDRALVRDVEQELVAVLRVRVSWVNKGHSSSDLLFFIVLFSTLRSTFAWLTCSGLEPGPILFFFTIGSSGFRGCASVCFALFI